MGAATVSVEYYPPTFSIEINGSPIDPEAAYSVRSVEVQLEINKAHTASFAVQDEFRAGQFKWLGHPLFKVGNTLRVSMGYGGEVKKLTDGKIQNINAEFPESGHPSFTVEGTDNAYQKLTVPCPLQVFKEKATADIVRKIASLTGLNADVEDVGDQTAVRTKKAGQSYLEYLKDLAKDGGYEVQLFDNKLYFRKARETESAEVTLEWGKNLISFKPLLNTSQAVTEIIVRGWDKKTKKPIEAHVRPGDERRQEPGRQVSSEVARQIFGDVVKEITDQPVNSMEEAKRIANAELQKISQQLVKGTAVTVGLPQLRPGACVELRALGTWFSGKYYLEKVTHRLDDKGFRTTFEARRNTL